MSVDVGTATGYLELDISKFQQALAKASTDVSTFGNKTEQSTSRLLSSASGKLTSAGSALTTSVTLPVVALGTTIAVVSTKFEEGMSKVAAVSGATGSEMEMLKGKAMEMGAKTKFSASEAADAFSYMAMAGWETSSMMEGIEGVMNLAAASGEDLAMTSDIVTDSLTAFGLKAEDTGHFVDVLAMASNKSNTNVAMLGESFKYVAPVAGALGYSVDDVAVALGLMANSGIKASQAGTSLRSLMTNLVKPTKQMRQSMTELGIEVTNADGTMKPFNQLLVEMRASFAGLTEEQKASHASTLAGKEGMSGLLAIVNATEGDFNKLTDAMANADGTAKSMSDVMNNNLAGQLRQLQGTLETICLQFGDIFLPVIKSVVESLQTFATWLENLSEGKKKFVAVLLIVLATLGPLLLLVGTFVGFLAKLAFVAANASAIMAGLSAAMAVITGPIGLAVAAVVALVAGFVYLYNTSESVRNALNSAWDKISEAMASAWAKIQPALSSLGGAIKNLFEAISPVLALIAAAFVNALGIVIGVVNGILQALGPVIAAIANVIDFVSNIIKAVVALLTGDFAGAGEYIMAAFGNVKDFFINIFSAIWEFIKGFASGFWDTLCTAFKMVGVNIQEFVSNAWTSLVDFFTQLPTNISNFCSQVLTNINTWVANMIAKAIEVGSRFLDSVVQFFKDLPHNIGYILGLAIGHVIKWTSDMITKAKETGQRFIENVITFFKELPGKVQTWFVETINKVTQWVRDMVSKAREAGSQFVDNVITFFRELPGKIKQKFIETVEKASQWVTDMGRKGKEAVSELINRFIDGAKKIPSEMMRIGRNIVDGVWNGIVAAKDWFVGKVKDFFSGIVDGVCSVLGIKSPSRVMEKRVGHWMAIGAGTGFMKAMPETQSMIQDSLDEAIDNVSVNDIECTPQENVAKTFSDNIMAIYGNLAEWFESVESRIAESVGSIANTLSGAKLALTDVSISANGNVGIGYVGVNGFAKTDNAYKQTETTGNVNKENKGDTFNFYSQAKLTPVECAREMKKTKKDMAEGF